MNLRDPAVPDSYTPIVRRLLTGEFDEGPGYATYRRRGTTDWLLVQTLGGRGHFSAVMADPGTITLVRPGTPHDYGVEEELRHWHFLFAHFHPKPDWLPLLDWPEVAPGIVQLRPGVPAAERIADHLREAVRHQLSVLPQGELLSVNSLEAALLWCDTQNPKAIRIDDRLLRAIELIDHDLKATLDVPRLARAVNLSVSRFAHLFREQLGVGPQQFVERRRLDAACRLLELTTRPVASVAAEVGYPDPLYFSTRFRRHTGTSPTAYRNR
ncbi:AraC family transcriptional regulator of arabinose operon [Kribbella sp. VKM Ac-2527]|uniref:AraC family transcriptional regulator of arabinose operon n=1 Tax=Kribbella caucasensis TaxID=2512215 RepID=A0A4R6KLU5_9ACTN|nr:helix-turn-helix domain-containing protein [Kribbella sp. VKM Ac-2527]TDO52527.1 AraC family transcriptional regulator of arabinose operon [Kribbella sp. VKM Ac-2527]